MNLVEFFGTVIKPKKVKGKGLFCPMETRKISDVLSCIRDKDVNIFFVKTKNGYIAIDSGYKNSKIAKRGMKALGISENEVLAVFLTHLDLDHAGGVDSRCVELFPKAITFVGCEEEKYLTKKYARKKILGISLASPIKLRSGYKTIDNDDCVTIDNVNVRAILSAGHTLGHLSYHIGDDLFVGDSLILNDNGEGYCFWDFWNADSKQNKESLQVLYEYAIQHNVKTIITSHSGIAKDIDKAFSHRNETLKWKQKDFVFRHDSPYDLYDERNHIY